MQEFSIIEQYFTNQTQPRRDVLVGVGDDCAITQIPENQVLATTTDTLVSGIHFVSETTPCDIAHKALAVNLSDLAAMGATPAWVSLALTLPDTNDDWLSEFADSFARLCEYYSINLIGGDTTQGPLSITITAQGFVPPESVIKRSEARPGDVIFVTGSLGDAGAGLALLQGTLTEQSIASDSTPANYLLARHNRPTPRVLAGTTLRRKVTSCIDISDGLIGDIRHIMKASQCGANINVGILPISEELLTLVTPEYAIELALSAGDDYELLFTVPQDKVEEVKTAMHSISLPITEIGQMTGDGELHLKLNNQEYITQASAYQHEIPLHG
mgnify:CR=1 FL=1